MLQFPWEKRTLGYVFTKTCDYRGGNGELHVGVRRVGQQHSSMPSSVISSRGMILGVLATASHAVSSQTRFLVYYKPRYATLLDLHKSEY